MNSLLFMSFKYQPVLIKNYRKLNLNHAKYIYTHLNQNLISRNSKELNDKFLLKKHEVNSILFYNQLNFFSKTSININDMSKLRNMKNNNSEPSKKQSKFKQSITQYGPIFIVIHLTTVVMWIYLFFLISKQ